MGAPEYLTRKQVEQLLEASVVVEEKQSITFEDGVITLKTDLPAHAVATITLGFNQPVREAG